jgi:hypothetical protein
LPPDHYRGTSRPRAPACSSRCFRAPLALALVVQATSFGEGFVLFALLTLPVVLFVGVATYVRLLEINNDDVVWVLA